MTKTVQVWLQGGLGNQLFQYGFGYWLSRKQDRDLYLRTELLPDGHEIRRGISRWPNQIDLISHQGQILRRTETFNRHPRVCGRLLGLEASISERTGNWLPSMGIFASPSHKDWEALSSRYANLDTIHLRSYFQDYRPIAEVEADLRTQILYDREQKEVQTGWDGQQNFAVHVRLGDLKNLDKNLEHKRVAFFTKARMKYGRSIAEKNLALFSDDPANAEKILKQAGFRGEFDFSGNSRNALTSLINISRCSGLLATPSSFAWWGGFLQKRQGQEIIFEGPWPGDSNTYKRPFPSWTLLET